MNAKAMSSSELNDRLRSLQATEPDPTGTPEQRTLAQLNKDLTVHQLELVIQNEDLRAAQSALEDSRNRYADLYDFSPVAHFTFDTKGCIQELNLTGAALLGRDRQHAIHLPFLALVRMEDPGAFWDHVRRVCKTKKAVTSELAFGTAETGVTYVQAVSVPVLDDFGAVTALRTAMTDVTARKQAEIERDRALASERAVRERIDRIDRAAEVATEALAKLGESGTLQEVLQVVVDQARRVLDAEFAAFGVADGAEKPFDFWVFSGVDPSRAAAIGRAPRAVGVRAAALRAGAPLRVADASAHPEFAGFPEYHPAITSLLAVPIRRGSRLFGDLFVAGRRGAAEFSAEDERTAEMLAERVAAALEIARLHEAARAALAARDHLLAIVSHDLRNPLSIITLNAAQLLQAGPDTPTVREPATVIKRTTSRMGRLIQDLLQVATLEAGELTIEPRAEDPLRLADESVEAQRPVTAALSLALEREPATGVPDVWCDRERVLQALANLIGNAAKFTLAGGRIRVGVEQRGDHVRFSVSDTGRGIPAAEIPRLFERYWKGKGERRDGTGLGLSIVKGIVEAHHGALEVQSELGAGTTIAFTLPVSKAPAREEPLPVPAPPQTERPKELRVLIVDDEPHAVSALATILRFEGLAPFEATGGEEALALLDEAKPDVLLLDMEMPGMNGLTLLEHVRERLPSVPAIVMSGYPPENPEIKSALHNRDVGYLGKPIDVDALLELLGRLTSTSGSRSAEAGA